MALAVRSTYSQHARQRYIKRQNFQPYIPQSTLQGLDATADCCQAITELKKVNFENLYSGSESYYLYIGKAFSAPLR